MTTRTSRRTITFRRPFVLAGFDRELPAGVYDVETDEELIEGLSFPAYRRILTVIHLRPTPERAGQRRTLTIDPNELDAALERDRAPAAVYADSGTDREAPEGAMGSRVDTADR